MRTRDRLLLPLCLGVLYLVWGSTYLAQRVAVASLVSGGAAPPPTLPPLEMAALRFLASGALLYAGLRATGAPPPSPREWRTAALTAVPLLVTGMGSAALGLARVPSGLSALMFGAVPLWTALFERLRGGRLRGLEGVGLAVGFTGVVLVASRGALRAEPAGAALTAFAAASYALDVVATRRAKLAPGVMGTASQMIAGGAMLAIASAASGEPLSAPGARAAWALAYLVLLGTVVAYSAFGWLIRNARPALATSYAYVNPIIALALGSALGGERFARADYAGLALVLAAVGLVGWAQRAPRAQILLPAEPTLDGDRPAALVAVTSSLEGARPKAR